MEGRVSEEKIEMNEHKEYHKVQNSEERHLKEKLNEEKLGKGLKFLLKS